MKVLVAYATRHGATRGIAERIAQRLEKNGLDVTLKPVKEAEQADTYDAFVIGSGAYAFHWLGEATAFVRQHQALLASRPAWLFSSGPVGDQKVDAKGRDVLESSRPKEFTELQAKIHPRDEHVFFGAYDPDAEPSGIAERFMKGFMHFMPSVRDALPAGDFRDWLAIDAWAEGIANELKAAQPVSATA
jgi:menaquinone-dependent protoporphyrinogen oxidase